MQTSLATHKPLLALALLALTACGGGGGSNNADNNDASSVAAAPPPPLVTMACADLAGRTIESSAIGIASGAATVATATLIDASAPGNVLGSHCQVRGSIAPLDPSGPANALIINFAVNLPEAWNGKAIQFGGGGFNGRLIDGTEQIRFGPATKPAPLALGYATFGDDGGHQSTSITDGRFAMSDESLANYGGQSLKKTRDVAMALIQLRYGKAPDKRYFLGTSTGGRDALTAIQRWPNDYDGVIANEPALNYTGTRLHNVAVGRALYNNGGAGWLNLPKTLLVQRTVMTACDGLDGARDGIISNVESCRMLNQDILASLRCAGGVDLGNSCLSDAQRDTVLAIESPLNLSYSLANGVTKAGGINILEGTLVAGPYTTRDLGSDPFPDDPAGSTDANMFVTGDQWVKYFVTRQANFPSLTFDPLNPVLFTQRVIDVSAITDSANPNLSPFLSRGGKVILLHGLADEVISNNSTIDYYNRVVTAVGQPAVDAGVRFYTVPGMGHGTGVFVPAWDSLAALENWVERGLAPSTAIVSDTVAGTSGRTRPLCQYPAWPKFRGSGSLDASVNFSCVDEARDPRVCANLPTAVTNYKGGNTFGEELTVSINPTALTYTVTVDVSLQRAAGTQRTGTLVPQGECGYSSSESGAVFTFGGNGVLLGGVNAPSGGGFLPLLAFSTTWNNAANPAAFPNNTVAYIDNEVGVHYDASGTPAPYVASGRLRTSGTYQTCRDPVTGGFIVFDNDCTQTTKGYARWNAAHGAFDLFATSPIGSTPVSGGTLSGSMVIGQVGGTFVRLVLWRESTARYGLRLQAPQLPINMGTPDGTYATLVTGSTSASIVAVSGASFTTGSSTAALTFNSPVNGAVDSTGAPSGQFIFPSGLLGFVPAGGNTFELGLKR